LIVNDISKTKCPEKGIGVLLKIDEMRPLVEKKPYFLADFSGPQAAPSVTEKVGA